MHVEAAEAAERARHQAALEEQRLAQELELRRAEVAKQRPTWMLAVTGLAIVAAIALGWYAIQRQTEAAAAAEAQHLAEADKAKAVAVAEDAQRQMDQMQGQLAVLDGKVAKALDDILKADTAAARAEAKAKLLRFQQEQADLRARQQKLEDDAAARKRKEGIHFSDKCLNNAVC